jgi:PAS domain S-box-containing protein
VWSRTDARLVLTVQPFFWQTTWFRALALAALLGAAGALAGLVMRGRLRRQLERLEQQQALAREQARLASVLEATSDFVGFSDVAGRMLYVNPAGRRIVGLDPDADVRGLRARDLLVGWAADKVEQEGQPFALANGLWSGETAFRGAEGREIPMSQVITAHRAPDGSVQFLSTIARDISHAKRAEAQVKASLREKDVLLKEVHHRVKNNLQIISSLLNLQSRHVRDPLMVQVLEDSKNRIRSMALVHERLYQSASLARIDVAEYMRSLAANLVGSYGLEPARVHLLVEVEPAELGIDTAVPCGLIANELVSNALKHAFPKDREGTIIVELRTQGEGQWRLRVSDNGVGWPEGLDFRATTTLGMQLVVTLTDQLGGTVERIEGRGTTFDVAFSEVRYKPRV